MIMKKPKPVSTTLLSRPSPLRWGIGVLLFLAWGTETILWITTSVHLVASGNVISGVTAVAALALLGLLCGMEGLEVSVIDRWQMVWPGRPPSHLAGWLAARQLFVALIVTTATLLANQSVIFIPGTSARITGGFTTGLFDLTWTGLTVLWFAQICPKHLGATNPDRYLARLQRLLFPLVAIVHSLGISQPGEWTADAVEYWLDWADPANEAKRQLPPSDHSLAAIWRELRTPRRRPADSGGPKPI
jgi:hypothetical protein